MSRDQEREETEGVAEKSGTRTKRQKQRLFRSHDGTPLFIGKNGKTNLKEFNVDKFDADVLAYWHGQEDVVIPGKTPKHAATDALIVKFDPENPIPDHKLAPGAHSPVCGKCNLNLTGCKNPYLPYTGNKTPIVTILLEGIGFGEDERGVMASDGSAKTLKRIIVENAQETGVNLEDVRWVSLTRCSNRGPKMLNLKSRGNWCRYHVVEDLMRYTPSMVMPVGTNVLGLLSHKSNAQEWSGRLLTYRGWPDDWLTNPKYALPRPNPRDSSKTVTGHPVFGEIPDWRIPMVPLQAPKIVYGERNEVTSKRYVQSIIRALKMAKQGVEALSYTRSWYDFSEDPDHVEARLKELAAHKNIHVTYDTETSGLRPWETTWERQGDDMLFTVGNARIVSMMFRWNDPATGEPRSLGFPWETKQWGIYPHRNRLRPLIWKILTQSILVGHNLTFDMLFSWATLNRKYTQLDKAGWEDSEVNRQRDARICALADACRYDTWHMAFAYQQKRGSLGLEAMAYDWVPDLAGYEEDFTLLIDLHREKMHPGEGKGGHYLNCDKTKTETHLMPYVMGDVEVAHKAFERIHEKLKHAKVYEIPIADPKKPGSFRWFKTRDRNWIYENIMSPASRVLMKMMARGIYISQDELKKQVEKMPAEIKSLRDELSRVDDRIVDYVAEMKATEGPDWELDLENKGQLKELLFNRLELPVLRLTKAGKSKLGENIDEIKTKFRKVAVKSAPELAENPHQLNRYVEKMLHEYAAVDKFTLNKLTVQLEKLRPLRKYRKAFKLYSTYIRPLQNITTSLDKRARKSDPHLCFDSCIHASFMLTGTRGGRLSCKDPNLQQLPRDGEVKSLFVSRFGDRGCIYQGDLSQIELRLLAAASGDPTMVKAYFDNVDLHTLTASRIFSMPYEQFSKDHMKKLQEKGQDDKAKELDTMRNIAKCVDPDTLVSVNGRIVRVGSLHPGRENDTFYDVSPDQIQVPGGTQPLRQFYSSGISKRLLVCSRHGLLACSTVHRFKLKDGSLVRAEDLKKGMILADVDALKSSEATGVVHVPFNPFSKEDINAPYTVKVDADYAYLLGLFYGDGCSTENRIEISTGGTPDFFDWQDEVARAIQACGFTATVRRTTWTGPKKTEKLGEINGSSGCVYFGSHRVLDVFYWLGAVDKENKRTLRVPDWMFNAPVSVKLSFLAGIVDTDGYVSATQGDMRVCTKSWLFAQDIMVLSRSVGIANTLQVTYNKAYERYYFVISFAKRHAYELGCLLRLPAKRDRIKKATFSYKNESPNAVLDVIELSDAHLVEVSLDAPHIYVPNGMACHQTVNFLTGYGGGAFGLQNVLAMRDIDKPIEECEEIIELFFDSYPAIRGLLRYYKKFIEENAVAVSIFGRVRVFEEVRGDDMEAKSKALRSGCNHLIQSTASDMMLTALFSIETLMREANLESILVSTVHDSLLIDCVREELPIVHEIVLAVLNNFPEVFKQVYGDDFDTSWMIVPFSGDTEVGQDYLHMQKLASKDVDWKEVYKMLAK